MSGGYTQSGLPFSGKSPSSRQRSYEAAESVSGARGTRTLQYIALLDRVGYEGVTDHDAARMLALPLSSICSIRNGCGEVVVPAGSALGPFGKNVTRWRKR